MIRLGVVLAAATAAAVGCSSQSLGVSSASESPTLVGSWTPSDGTSTKVFNEGGSCRGFFYDSSTGRPLDIGGPMECQLSSHADDSGQYKLLVTQSPNEATYLVKFSGDDAATVYSKNGKELYSLSRF